MTTKSTTVISYKCCTFWNPNGSDMYEQQLQRLLISLVNNKNEHVSEKCNVLQNKIAGNYTVHSRGINYCLPPETPPNPRENNLITIFIRPVGVMEKRYTFARCVHTVWKRSVKSDGVKRVIHYNNAVAWAWIFFQFNIFNIIIIFIFFYVVCLRL